MDIRGIFFSDTFAVHIFDLLFVLFMFSDCFYTCFYKPYMKLPSCKEMNKSWLSKSLIVMKKGYLAFLVLFCIMAVAWIFAHVVIYYFK